MDKVKINAFLVIPQQTSEFYNLINAYANKVIFKILMEYAKSVVINVKNALIIKVIIFFFKNIISFDFFLDNCISCNSP